MVSFNEVVAPTIYIVEAVRGFLTYVFLTQRSAEGYAEERRVFGKRYLDLFNLYRENF